MANPVQFQEPPSCHTDVASKAEYVFIIGRHGERTPLTHCTNLIKSNPEGYGELTKAGREQCRNLGKKIRARYSHILKGQRGEVGATCNKIALTKESTYAVLEGLGAKEVTPTDDPTDYVELETSAFIARYNSLMGDHCLGRFRTIREIVDYVIKNAGSPTEPKEAEMRCLDSVITHVHNGHPIPEWAKNDWEKIIWADNRLFTMSLAKSKKRIAAFAMNHFLEALEHKFEKKRHLPEKIHLFITVDIVVYSFIHLLCSKYEKRPLSRSCFYFEVFMDNVEPKVHFGCHTEMAHTSMQMDYLSNPCGVHELTRELRSIMERDEK